MNRETVSGLSVVCLAVAIYLCVAKPGEPPPMGTPEVPAAVVVLETTPPPPVALAAVVDVTDLDPLLDPPSKLALGAPFDDEMPTFPANTQSAPERIPPATEFPDLETAPMPREVASETK